MPKPCPKEFREDMIWVARGRERGIHLKQVATDFGVSDELINVVFDGSGLYGDCSDLVQGRFYGGYIIFG